MPERAITFTSDNYTLEGTFITPEANSSPLPVVLMLPGSGQTDRDDNAPKLAINLFPQMAEAMRTWGFASLRYDKRGVGASEGDYWSSDFTGRLHDAAAALAWLASQPDIDRKHIYVLGHSEGALVATHLAANNESVAGAILLAGSAKTGEETLLWQGERIAGSLTGASKWIIDHFHIDPLKKQRQYIERIKHSTGDTIRMQLVQKVNAKWMRQFLAYDPKEDLAKVTVPVLAITGANDLQVDSADLARMKQLVKGHFESHLIPKLTHLLRTDPTASLRTYKEQVRKPVDEQIIKYMQVWLKEQIHGNNQ